MREMGPRACRRGLVVSTPPTPQYSLDGRWRDVMTVVSGRGAHVPMQVEAVTLQVMSLLQEVVQVKALLV